MKRSFWDRPFWKRVYNITEQQILTAALVFGFLTIVIVGISYPYYRDHFHSFYGQILAEAHGMLFDLAIIGILLVWLRTKGEKSLRIKTYKDEIDDFRLWESEEAAFRTVGNIKRLNRYKIFNIDLSNCHLVKTKLNYVVLTGANLNYANFFNSFLLDVNFEDARLNQTNFENCNMNQSVLRGAYANGANFKDTYLVKTNFENAFLIRANFENAFLMEANLQNADLTEADFTNANLYKADLRGVKGLTKKQLSKARTLYLTQFDPKMQQEIKELHPNLIGADEAR